MQFIDEVRINITSGSGGNGCISFRREKHEPMGGPNGGNGGRGGDVIFRSNKNINTLINYRFKKYFNAQNGENGKGSNKSGKSGENLILEVPVGTQIFSDDEEIILFDFTDDGQSFTILEGGKGGIGNSAFKSSIRQAPLIRTEGVAGEMLDISIKLKLLSDAGLIGLPNAGKSTFLSKVTAAKPKIANYPFTTLKPMLGIVRINEEEFVLADIPGLIEGAHHGHGLGDKFLKHIERCNILIHVIDVSMQDIVNDYQIIRNELDLYSEKLKEKLEIICLNKIELLSEEDLQHKIKEISEVTINPIFLISAYEGKGLKPVLNKVLEFLQLGDPE